MVSRTVMPSLRLSPVPAASASDERGDIETCTVEDPQTTTTEEGSWQVVVNTAFDKIKMNGALRGQTGHGQSLSLSSKNDDGAIIEIVDSQVNDNSVDVWQRTPLLQDCQHDDNEEDEELDNCGRRWQGDPQQNYYEKSSPRQNGMVKIEVPPPDRAEPKFPKEKGKTLLAFLFLVVNFIVTVTSLSIVHERMPDRTKVPPLPDVLFDIFPPQDWALNVSEIIIIVSTNTCLLVIFLHRHRLVILRRCFLIIGILYLMRSVTMFVTQVPVASTTYYCSPKANSTSPTVIVNRVLQLLSGFGLSINGQHTYCGDYIYSGHTVILTMTYMVIREYTPRRCYLLHWLFWLTSMLGVVMVLISRGHYTVDALIAYYVTTRVFWMYHTMCNNMWLKEPTANNYLTRVWWYCLFRYFEKNVNGVVPRQYEWPLPWPRRFKRRDRDS